MSARRSNPCGAIAATVAALICCGQPHPSEAQTRTSMSPEIATFVPRLPQQQSPAADANAGEFQAFLAALWPEAKARGVSRATFDQALRGVTLDQEVLSHLENQPEHTKSASEYMGQLVSPLRIEAGRSKLAELRPLLARIEAAFGVDRHVVLAIWGVESSFGTAMGGRPVVRSLATLAFGDRRRPQYWRGELLTTLKVLQRGEVTAEQMVGSWAGAMGHTQFMPASYAAHAVDFDADRRRDIWSSVPDALASTASYLKASGWLAGEPWGYEAVLPPRFDCAHADPAVSHSLFEWLELGVRPPPGRTFLPTARPLQLILPAGARGPAFLVTRNFRAILRYNSSTLYALAVGHLADRLAGAPELATKWPADDRALDRAERVELQQRLLALGLDAGDVDGVIGGQTRAAIRVFQRSSGLPTDGHPGPALLDALRRAQRS
jgi:peptidoglycan lytic transglycosylase B